MKRKFLTDPLIRDKLEKMNPGKDADKLTREFYKRKKKLCLLILGAGTLLGIFLFFSEQANGRIEEDGTIRRADYGGEALRIPASVETYDQKAGEVTIEVSALHYTKEELPVLFAEAFSYLKSEMAGNNESLSRVTEDLVFPASYGEDGVEYAYLSSDYSLVDTQGRVHNESLKEEREVTIEVTMYYGDVSEKKDVTVTVCPLVLTAEEKFLKELNDSLKKEDADSIGSEVYTLPQTVGEKEVVFREKKEHASILLFILTAICTVAFYKGMDRDLDKSFAERQRKLLFAYPDFTGKLALLTGAGMSVTGALRKIARDGAARGPTPLYEELEIYVRSLDNGMLEERALENFSLRVALPQYRKCCGLIATNVKKGSVNLGVLLEQEAEDAFVAHQSSIRKLGEEAGTKLLLPMVMMLGVVMVLIMVPAFLNYQV